MNHEQAACFFPYFQNGNNFQYKIPSVIGFLDAGSSELIYIRFDLFKQLIYWIPTFLFLLRNLTTPV